MTFEWREDLRKYFDTAPEFKIYRESNRGEYRVLRCDFPSLMGWSTLRRPNDLPRSMKAPYFAGPSAPSCMTKETILRPHENRFRVYRDTKESHQTLRKYGITMKDGPALYKGKWGELRTGKWSAKTKDILVRMYCKTSPQWKEIEGKMLKEVCTVMETGHPNFLQYYGYLENDFWKYHLFEYMPKGDLLTVLKGPEGTLFPTVIKSIFVNIVYAISHLHDKDIVHRNLKLENILIGQNWEVRIIDISHTQKTTAQNRGERTNISKTTFNSEYGPVMYKSPERINGWGFNPLLDQVWGLGVILYALIFKKFPFSFPQDDEKTVIEMVENGCKFVRNSPHCPDGARDLLYNIFQWEEHRPRTFELFDDLWLSTYPEVEDMKRNNAIGRFSHEYADKLRNEPKRMLALRRRMFKHFKLFRGDYKRQPAIQTHEVTGLEGTLENAQRFLGERNYGIHEVTVNVKEQHKVERLYKDEYWPRLYGFNPLKCRYLGINRAYCKAQKLPVHVNLKRLADKDIPAYGQPPERTTDNDETDAIIAAIR